MNTAHDGTPEVVCAKTRVVSKIAMLYAFMAPQPRLVAQKKQIRNSASRVPVRLWHRLLDTRGRTLSPAVWSLHRSNKTRWEDGEESQTAH
jgi:hypothetical protein